MSSRQTSRTTTKPSTTISTTTSSTRTTSSSTKPGAMLCSPAPSPTEFGPTSDANSGGGGGGGQKAIFVNKFPKHYSHIQYSSPSPVEESFSSFSADADAMMPGGPEGEDAKEDDVEDPSENPSYVEYDPEIRNGTNRWSPPLLPLKLKHLPF